MMIVKFEDCVTSKEDNFWLNWDKLGISEWSVTIPCQCRDRGKDIIFHSGSYVV